MRVLIRLSVLETDRVGSYYIPYGVPVESSPRTIQQCAQCHRDTQIADCPTGKIKVHDFLTQTGENSIKKDIQMTYGESSQVYKRCKAKTCSDKIMRGVIIEPYAFTEISIGAHKPKNRS